MINDLRVSISIFLFIKYKKISFQLICDISTRCITCLSFLFQYKTLKRKYIEEFSRLLKENVIDKTRNIPSLPFEHQI